MNKSKTGGLIGFLVVLNLSLLAVNQFKRPQEPDIDLAPPTTYIASSTLPPVPVIDRRGQVVRLDTLAGGRVHTLFVFFGPSDCPGCLAENSLWMQIPEQAGIPVVGIAMSPSADEFWRWLDHLDLDFETFLDTTDAVAESLGLTATPLKVLADSNGTILWADPTRAPGVYQQSFWRELEYAASEEHGN